MLFVHACRCVCVADVDGWIAVLNDEELLSDWGYVCCRMRLVVGSM